MTTTTNETLADLLIINDGLAEQIQRSFQTIFRNTREALREQPEIWERHERIVRLIVENVKAIMVAGCPEGERVRTVDANLAMADHYVENGQTAHYILTEDGKPIFRTWHQPADGPTSGEQVRYETWSWKGQTAHGYVDSVSRKIVQTG